MKIGNIEIPDAVVDSILDGFIEIVKDCGATVVAGAVTAAVKSELRERGTEGICRSIAWAGHAISGEIEKANQEWAYATMSLGQCLAVLDVTEREVKATMPRLVPRIVAEVLEKKLAL